MHAPVAALIRLQNSMQRDSQGGCELIFQIPVRRFEAVQISDYETRISTGIARSIRQTEGQGCDIMQPMRALVIGYIEAHPEIILCDVEEVTERVAKALEHDRAVAKTILLEALLDTSLRLPSIVPMYM